MRTIAPVRRLAAAAACAFLSAGVVLATATPAAADPPELRFENSCGAVAFTWDTGTIGGDDTWATTVLRGTVIIEEFVMHPRGRRAYGAADGDVFEIRRAGLHPQTFVHESPSDCISPPRLTVTASNDCAALRLNFTNAGTTPVTGLQLLVDGSAPYDLAAIEPGEHAQSIELPDGTRFMVHGPRLTGGWLTWLTGTYATPEDCAAPSTPASPAGGSLPLTGPDTRSMWIAGALLAGAGVVLVLAARRRRIQKG